MISTVSKTQNKILNIKKICLASLYFIQKKTLNYWKCKQSREKSKVQRKNLTKKKLEKIINDFI